MTPWTFDGIFNNTALIIVKTFGGPALATQN